MTQIKEWMKKIHQTAVEHGWWDNDVICFNCSTNERNFGEQIGLMHSELSEALEEYRNGRPLDYLYFSDYGDESEVDINLVCDKDNFGNLASVCKLEGVGAEFADTIIRILDTCEKYGIDIEKAIEMKMAYNENRPYRHGGKLC